MHSNINLAAEKRVVDFLREQTLATDVCKRLVQDFVASCLDDDNLKSTLLGKLGEGFLKKDDRQITLVVDWRYGLCSSLSGGLHTIAPILSGLKCCYQTHLQEVASHVSLGKSQR